MPTAQSQSSRRGLTLMELIVVLAILVALAAILVPMFPNLLRRTHKSTDATQSSEVSKAVQLYHATYLGYPDQWDLMTVATGTTPPDFLPADGGVPFGGGTTIGNLTADEVAALGRVGIVSGHHFVATAPNHPTMDPYSGPVNTPTPFAATTPVFLIQAGTGGAVPANVPNEIKNIIARDPSARFVVFGVGVRSTMVGKVIQNAPTSVPQNNNFTPSTLYSRVGAIFQVSGVGINAVGGGTERARFICACALEDDELESTEKDIVGYYDVVKSGQ